MKKITILVADDHTLMRQTLSFVLSGDIRFTVIAECGNGEDVVKLSEQLQPDIVLLDIHLPGINGIEAMAKIRQVSSGSKVLAISQYSQTGYVRKIMQAGSLGYITKGSTLEETQEAILTVRSGKKYICKEIRNRLAEEFVSGAEKPVSLASLTARETEIIGYIQKGHTSKEIARALNISFRTVELHRCKILKKMRVKNSLSLVRFINDNAMGSGE